jgi:hypothetical protein
LPFSSPGVAGARPDLARDVARVVAVAVLLADLAVLAVYDEFALLPFREAAAFGYRLFLRVVCGADVFVDFEPPAARLWDHVYVGHPSPPPSRI